MFDEVRQRRDEELLTQISAAQRQINMLTGEQLALVAEFATGRPAPATSTLPGRETACWGEISEFASAELAVALTLTRRSADRLFGLAHDLDQLPLTAAALRAGELDLRRVQVIADGTAELGEQDRRAVEARVLPKAAGQTSAQLAAAVRRAVLRHAPRTVAEQEQRAVEARAVWRELGPDGLSRLIAEGPTHDILRLYAATTAMARTLPGEGGDFDQLRFDALSLIADTILDDPALPKTRFGRPGIVLLADRAAQARLADAAHAEQQTAEIPPQPVRSVELLGAGVISDSLVRQLLAAAHTTMLTLDPTIRWACEHTGGYQISDKLARHLTAVHRYCAFPGCRIPAHDCDWDHVTPWPAGPTCACNLIPLCRYHHRLKTHTAWRVTLHPDRRVEWTSPTGRVHTVYPTEDDEAA